MGAGQVTDKATDGPIIDYDELFTTFEAVVSSDPDSVEAFLDTRIGRTYVKFVNAGLEDDLPDDLEDSDHCVTFPDKMELDLGKNLVSAFAHEKMPDDIYEIRDQIRGKGGDRRFEAFLARRNMLQEWYDFEANAIEAVFHAWVGELGLTLTESTRKRPPSKE